MRTEKYMRIESAVMVDTQYREKPVLKYQYDYYPESRRQDIYNWINEQMYRCDVYHQEVAEKYAQLREQGIEFPQLQ